MGAGSVGAAAGTDGGWTFLAGAASTRKLMLASNGARSSREAMETAKDEVEVAGIGSVGLTRSVWWRRSVGVVERIEDELVS